MAASNELSGFQCVECCAIMYEHDWDFANPSSPLNWLPETGDEFYACGNDPNNAWFKDNDVSSFILREGWELHAWDGENYSGQQYTFTTSMSFKDYLDCCNDNTISSIQCVKK